MSTLIITGLLLFLVPGLAVLVGDHLFRGTETYTISTRELPNIAADLAAPDVGSSGTGGART
jgi:hypothetical protein